jgi:molybdenum cofactor cytidylyltransferase
VSDSQSAAVAVVPAAGASSRFGSMKLLADVDGHPLLEHTLQSLLDGGVGRIVLVVTSAPALGTVPLIGDARVILAVNPDPSRGMFSSIQTGLEAAGRGDPFVVLPADMPFVPPDVIAAVIAEARRTDTVVVPTHAGRRGHPVVIPGRFRRPILEAAPSSNLKDVLASICPGPVHELHVEAAGVLRDVDVPGDLMTGRP